MANPLYGQNKADSHVGSEWILASAPGTQPAQILNTGSTVGYAIAPFAAKVTGVMYNLTVATTTAATVLTVADGAANAIDTVSIPVQAISTGGVLLVDDSDADATVAEGEAISLTSDNGADAGAAILWVRFERI
tara:strand:- start:56 stop:457 length:402 start_codon:yes stop_codon:yes gene_type:complete